MLDVRVSDMHTARRDLYGWATHIISLLDPEVEADWQRQPTAAHLVLGFDDVERDEVGAVAPQRTHLHDILAFAASIGADARCLVHCHAGISRSTAAAIAILIGRGVEPKVAFEQIRVHRSPLFWPNQRLVDHTDRHFELGGTYARHVVAWKVAQRSALQAEPGETATVFLSRLAAMEVAPEDW